MTDLRHLLFLLILTSVACSIKPNVKLVDRKTSLELQLIGAYDKLGDELTLISSARARESARIGPEGSGASASALRARRRQLFNRDDLDNLRTRGCVLEKHDGTITDRACDFATGDWERRRKRIVGEENADRAVLVEYAISIDPALGPGDRPALQRAFQSIQRDRAQPGWAFEEKSGEVEVVDG